MSERMGWMEEAYLERCRRLPSDSLRHELSDVLADDDRPDREATARIIRRALYERVM